jgi:hypothetical protein
MLNELIWSIPVLAPIFAMFSYGVMTSESPQPE